MDYLSIPYIGRHIVLKRLRIEISSGPPGKGPVNSKDFSFGSTDSSSTSSTCSYSSTSGALEEEPVHNSLLKP